MNQTARAVLILPIVVMAIVACAGPTADPDIFWHLKIGQVALHQRSSLPVETFSSHFAGAPWRYKDLLSDLILYGGFSVLGFGWFLVLKVLAVLAMAAAYAAAPRPAHRSPVVLLCLVALLCGSLNFVERPNLFSLALFPALLALGERARRGAQAKGVRPLLLLLGPIVLLSWVWICLHRAALLGYVVIASVAGSLLLCRTCMRWPRLARLFLAGPAGTQAAVSRQAVLGALLVTAIAPLLGLANPSGLAIFKTSVGVVESQMLRQYITEWQPVGLRYFLSTVTGMVSALGLCAWTVRMIVARRRRDDGAPVDLWHGALLLLFGWLLCTDSVRWHPYLVMVALLILGLLLGELAALLALRLPGGRRPRGLMALLFLLLPALLLAQRTEPFLIGEGAELQPAGAVAFAREHRLTGPVTNAYGLGGYLIWKLWPEVQVLVDGRNDMVYPTRFVVQALRAQRDPAELARLLSEAPSTWVMAWNRPDNKTHLFLAQDPEWALVYWSDVAAIYVLRSAHPELLPLRFRFIDPAQVVGSVARVVQQGAGDPATLRALRDELRRMLEASPRSIRAGSALLLYYHLLGPAFLSQRDEVLRHLDSFAGDDPAFRQLKSQLGLEASR